MTRIEAELARDLKIALNRLDDLTYLWALLDIRLRRIEEQQRPQPEPAESQPT